MQNYINSTSCLSIKHTYIDFILNADYEHLLLFSIGHSLYREKHKILRRRRNSKESIFMEKQRLISYQFSSHLHYDH
jgi:23S rRNA maturation mini-RNase III